MRLLLPQPPHAGEAGPGKPAPAVVQAGAPSNPLFGGWSATRWQYSNAFARSVDVVCDLGGSVSLSLSPDAFILAHTVGGRASPGVSGTLEVRGDELVLHARGYFGAQAVRFRQAGETLSLYSNESGWDFDGDGREEAAEFVGVLVRL